MACVVWNLIHRTNLWNKSSHYIIKSNFHWGISTFFREHINSLVCDVSRETNSVVTANESDWGMWRLKDQYESGTNLWNPWVTNVPAVSLRPLQAVGTNGTIFSAGTLFWQCLLPICMYMIRSTLFISSSAFIGTRFLGYSHCQPIFFWELQKHLYVCVPTLFSCMASTAGQSSCFSLSDTHVIPLLLTECVGVLPVSCVNPSSYILYVWSSFLQTSKASYPISYYTSKGGFEVSIWRYRSLANFQLNTSVIEISPQDKLFYLTFSFFFLELSPQILIEVVSYQPGFTSPSYNLHKGHMNFTNYSLDTSTFGKSVFKNVGKLSIKAQHLLELFFIFLLSLESMLYISIIFAATAVVWHSVLNHH